MDIEIPPSTSRGFLFFGFSCGKNRPWQPDHKTWREVYAEKVGWPAKPEVPEGESKVEAFTSWAAEDFGNFCKMGVELRYLEALGEWFVIGKAFLGADILPRRMHCNWSDNHLLYRNSIASFCQVMRIKYEKPHWHLTSISFDKEEDKNEESDQSQERTGR